ncbi:MAG: hypothetical protein MUF13_07955, partial [Akkermansiaceae bacterium]|nr:hypothetical protein [Akkermansiaceae bacterium]
MTKATNTDPRVWPLAAFVLPLLVLLGIGAFGLWRERALGTGEQARSLAWYADSAASSAGRILEKEMADWAWTEVRVEADGRVKGRAWFRQSPLPQEETAASLAFTEGRFQDVMDQDPGAVSPGGIPLGPKAAFRLLQQAPDDGVALQAAKKVRELAFAFPSVISPELLEATDGEMERRSLKETRAGEWRERWEKLEQVARTLEKLLDGPLPVAGFVVRDLLDETWLVAVRKERESHLIRIVPLNGVIRTIRQEWENLPQEKGMFLALKASDRDLLAGPEGSATWPKASAELVVGNLRVVALGDPSTAERATRLRIALLGSVGLLAGVMVSMGWWRQQSAVRLQQELARQKDDFLSTVSHELRTPVASMQLLAENLASGAASAPETIAAYHRRLLIESRRLASTTEHLLDFSLMESGQKAYRFARLDPKALGDEILAVLL